MRFSVSVDALALQRVLAFLGEEELEERVEDDEKLLIAVEELQDTLHEFAEANPEFDECED